MKVAVVLGIISLLVVTEAKVFSRCELAKELVKHGIPRSDLPNWICLIESESGRNSRARGGPNYNGSYDNGLFQINDQFWCMNGRAGHDCNVSCEALRTDNIAPQIQCALLIKKRQGWNAWYGWKNKCHGRSLPNINVCF